MYLMLVHYVLYVCSNNLMPPGRKHGDRTGIRMLLGASGEQHWIKDCSLLRVLHFASYLLWSTMKEPLSSRPTKTATLRQRQFCVGFPWLSKPASAVLLLYFSKTCCGCTCHWQQTIQECCVWQWLHLYFAYVFSKEKFIGKWQFSEQARRQSLMYWELVHLTSVNISVLHL